MSSTLAAPGETRQRVLDYFVRQADMDGVVIVPRREAAGALGLSLATVEYHLRILLEGKDLIKVGSHSSGPGHPIDIFEIAESHL